MNDGFWIAEAMELLQARAPEMSDELALDTANNIQAAWPDVEPPLAVLRYFDSMPLAWMRSAVTPLPLVLVEPREVAHRG